MEALASPADGLGDDQEKTNAAPPHDYYGWGSAISVFFEMHTYQLFKRRDKFREGSPLPHFAVKDHTFRISPFAIRCS